MGLYVDLHSYNYDKLVKGIKEIVGEDVNNMVETILLAGGSNIDDRYIILNNEHYEEFNSYYNVPQTIDEYFEVDDVFGKVFCTIDNKYEHKELKATCEPPKTLLYELGIEVNDNE